MSGTSEAVFENAVKDRGNIVTLIRSTNNHVFGGFFVDVFSIVTDNWSTFSLIVTEKCFKVFRRSN